MGLLTEKNANVFRRFYSATSIKTCSYDTWGNLTYDGRKGMSVNWNILNLASSASLPGGTFSYTWLSDGTKPSSIGSFY